MAGTEKLKYRDNKKAYQRKWYLDHKESNKEKHRSYYLKYQEEIKARRRAYYADNREREARKMREYRLANPDLIHGVGTKRRYGIDQFQYALLLKKQKNKCAVCRRDRSTLNRRLHVDHDHETNKIRGLLCSNCNLSLGYAKDNLKTLRQMIKYLQR